MAKSSYSYKGKPISSVGKRGKSGKGSGCSFWLWVLLVFAVIVGTFWYFYGRETVMYVEGFFAKTAETVSLAVDETKSLVKNRGTESVDSEKKKLLDKAKSQFESRDYSGARNTAGRLIAITSEKEQFWIDAAGIAGAASMMIFNGEGTSPEVLGYTAKRGDTLSRVAAQFGTTVEALVNLNRMSAADTSLRVGQKISVYKGDWLIKLSPSGRRLYLYDGGKFFKMYPVSVADEFNSAPGKYSVRTRIKCPVWKNGGRTYPPVSPENILGTRLLECADPVKDGAARPFWIHGTNNPNGVGNRIKGPGFIGMKNEDINELFSIVPSKTQVELMK